MAGTEQGGKHAAATNKKKYGADYYARIGAAGGRKSKGRLTTARARKIGRIGGLATNSRQGKK
jgi:hypothetical protein